MDDELRERLNTIENKLDEIIRYIKPDYVRVDEQQKLWRQQQDLARQMFGPIGSR